MKKIVLKPINFKTKEECERNLINNPKQILLFKGAVTELRPIIFTMNDYDSDPGHLETLHTVKGFDEIILTFDDNDSLIVRYNDKTKSFISTAITINKYDFIVNNDLNNDTHEVVKQPKTKINLDTILKPFKFF